MVNGNPPNTDLINDVAQLLGGETWETVHRLTTYRLHLKDDENQTVEINVKFNPENGWSIVAVDVERGLTATGNPDHDLGVALHTVHWQKLDQ